MVESMDGYYLVLDSLLQEAITTVDFGQSYAITSPPANYMPGTVVHYTPPEMRFEQRAGPEADVWMLACAIFEIRAGHPLFPVYFGGNAMAMRSLVRTLGKLPEPWWAAYEDRGVWFEEDGTAKPAGKTHEGDDVSAIRAKLKMIGTRDDEPYDEEGEMIEKTGVRMPDAEVDLLEDLLLKMLKYHPEDRIPLHDVLKHEWFSYSDQ